MIAKFHRHLTTSSFLLLTSAFLSACSQRADVPLYPYGHEGYAPPSSPAPINGAPASYTSSLKQNQLSSRQNVAMSDEESDKQPAGTTVSRQTGSSESVIKKGKIKKQTTTSEEIIETSSSTVIETIAVPSPDQDAR
jgi:hypothetical protein